MPPLPKDGECGMLGATYIIVCVWREGKGGEGEEEEEEEEDFVFLSQVFSRLKRLSAPRDTHRLL